MLKHIIDRVKRHLWWLSAVIVFCLNQWMSSGFGNWYLRYPFQVIRHLYDYSLGWIPFPSIYLVFVLLIWFLMRLSSNANRNSDTVLGYLKLLLMGLLKLIAIFYSCFYILWGFNYKASSLNQQLDFLTPEVEQSELLAELKTITTHLEQVRAQLSKDTFALSEKPFHQDTEDDIRFHLREIIHEWGIPNSAKVRIRRLKPKGLLMRISTAGVYIPFAMEGHIDAGLHPVQWPFTMAHEMSHGYGYTDEGTCNFIAYLVCLRSDDAFVQYSGLLGYWRYLASNYRRLEQSEYSKIRNGLSVGIKNDLRAIYTYQDRYPDILPAIRNAIYDSYLKSNGVSQGLKSYSTIVAQCLAWQKTEYNRDIFRKWYGMQDPLEN